MWFVVVLCTSMGGQESGGGERLERSVGDGVRRLEVADEEALLPVEVTLHVEVTVHAELGLLDDELFVEAIDGQVDAQVKRPMSHFDSVDRMR